MKKPNNYTFFRQANILFIVVACFFYSCNKNKNIKPTVATIGISDLTSQSVTFKGKVNNPDNFMISGQGIVWSINSNPVLPSSFPFFTSEDVNSSSFNSKIFNLQPNTKYYARSYITDYFGNIFFSHIFCCVFWSRNVF